MSHSIKAKSGQAGVALITGLVMLLVLTMIGLAATRNARIELRMAGNAEAQITALQSAQAITDAVHATPAEVPVTGGTGFRICTPAEPDCDLNTLTFDGTLFPAEIDAGHLSSVVERLDPEEFPVPRGLETSSEHFAGAGYRITATYDRSADKLGRAEVSQGMLVLIPKN